jgi:cytochrome c-type biogenesis protein CcmH
MRHIILLCLALFAQAALPSAPIAQVALSSQQEKEYKTLLQELRCLVCQNQDLADSNASLAKDLRKEVFNLVQGGQSKEAIRSHLRARYGDFILFKPPLLPTTLALWFGPFVLLGFGFIIVWRILRK